MQSLWLDTRPPGPSDPFVPGTHADVVVVGAGLTGLVTAVMLAEAGRRVVVLEARQLGAVTSGNTTAKISLLQGTVLSTMLQHTTKRVAGAYVEGNREGQAWLLDFCAAHGVPVQRRPAFTYAEGVRGYASVKQEFRAARRLGLDVALVSPDELPYRTRGAVRLANQAQFDPVVALRALAAELRSLGGELVEGVRVIGVDVNEHCEIDTDQGTLAADQLVLATGIPILDRGLYWAKLTAQRSYVVAFRVPGPIPQGMYLSADSPARSLRTATQDGAELLLIGGNGHVVGRSASPRQAVADLVAWTTENFPGAVATHRWSAQDYQSHNLVPFIGTMPRSRGRIWLATGYHKWGMTNSVMAALRISNEMVGREVDWAKPMRHRVSRPRDLTTTTQANAAVGAAAVLGWAGAAVAPPLASVPDPAEGEAVTAREGSQPVGVSTVDGTTCAVSLVCPHLKGVLRWNDAELSWDCPLHGSRFSAAGRVLEGPSTSDLTEVRRPEVAADATIS